MSYEQQVWNAWIAGGIFSIALVLYLVLSHRAVDHGPTLLARGIAYLIMLREQRRARQSDGMNPVYIPVSQYGMDAGCMETEESAAPDIDAVDAGMPRVSSHLSDIETIAMLSMQRGKDGKHRYSANAIHALVGGDRNAVLARVKELRAVAPPAEYMQPDGTKTAATYPITGQRTPA